MKLKLREEYTQPLPQQASAKQIWQTVLFTLVIIASVITASTPWGKALHLWHKLEWTFLIFLWGRALYDLIRYKNRALVRPVLINLVLWSVWIGTDLLPHAISSRLWVQIIYYAAFLAFILPMYLQIVPKAAKPPADTPVTHP